MLHQHCCASGDLESPASTVVQENAAMFCGLRNFTGLSRALIQIFINTDTTNLFFFFIYTHSYFQPSLAKGLKANNQGGNPIEMSSLVGPINDLDHTPFRSLRPRSQISSSGSGLSSPKTQRPVVCSVAPNLPARPPSSSDNDSIRKNHWDMDYEGVYFCVFV